ncbi:YlmC/YmxH family sporulation protein [uncultured Gemmiger sp.]|uniref:YlmC/YmxH family sporulation protein n=1 Tax=uncultured Gemmiger sp. TaxID=1623490 RepID=UPI0025D1FD8D|nr:YlmC/YmxH family sporulation protein [uncultured Gemmiger sp.]
MTLSDLKHKDVIQFTTGENLGRVDDVRFDEVSAQLQAVILHGRRRLFGLLGRDEDLEISWKNIKSIGLDVVMVDTPEAPPRSSRRFACR